MTDHRPDTDDATTPRDDANGVAGQRQRDGEPRYVEVGVSRSGRQADPAAPNAQPGEDIPEDAGRRGYVDEKTGEVHGSGADAGGGTGTENYESAGGGDDTPAPR